MQPEPRVLAADVQLVLQRIIRRGDPEYGEAVQSFATRTGVSTRTIYRALAGQGDRGTHPPAIGLGMADRLVTAAGRHLSECRVLTAAGAVVEYSDV